MDHGRLRRAKRETNNIVALETHFTGNPEDLDERVKSLMEKSENFCANGKQKLWQMQSMW